MQWFRNASLRTKLLTAFIALAVVAGAVGYIGVTNIQQIVKADEELYDFQTVPLAQIGDAATSFHKTRMQLLNLVLSETAEQESKALAAIQGNIETFEKHIGEFEKGLRTNEEKQAFQDFQSVYQAYQPLRDEFLALAQSGKKREAMTLLRTTGSKTVARLDEVIEGLKNQKIEDGLATHESNASMGESALTMMLSAIGLAVALAVSLGLFISRGIANPVNKVITAVNAVVAANQEITKASQSLAAGDTTAQVKNQAEKLSLDQKDEIGALAQAVDSIIDSQNSLKQSFVDMSGTITQLIAEATMLSNAAVAGKLGTRGNAEKFQGGYRDIVQGVNATLDAVVKPVQEGSATLAVMATGDMTARMTGDYHGDLRLIKESINKVGESLEEALQKVSSAGGATASASSQISSSTEEMAAGAQEQTSQAGEVASAVEEMTKTIMETSKNASVAAETAKLARVSAEQGGKVVDDTVEGMKRIAEVVNKSAETVKELGRSSDQIGEIIGVIDDIADQTNLLALNAAIESARAGDQGRGFEVVADEVRKLAERTTKATKEIAGMIKKIQSDTTGAVQSMEEGTTEVERGIELADKAGSSLKEIVGVSQKVTDMVTQIAAASEEQSSASEQISKNVESISKVTGETAQGTQQIARAAEDLNRLTENLQKLIGDFRLGRNDGVREPARSGVSVKADGALVAR
ncbi:MAG: MCP four helix bundle domain-containing protein [Bacteroidetes bacterium]|nr:MCP four helix bundle domain-containing protein [Bacteroidota bacterium]